MGLAVLTQLMLAVLDSIAVPATEAEARMVSIPVAVPVAAKVAVPVAMRSFTRKTIVGSWLLKRNLELKF